MEREPLSPLTAGVGLFFVLCVAAGGAVAALVRYDLIGFGHLPRTALTALVLLLLVNLVARPLRRRNLFPSAQLLYVYLAVLVVSGFPGQQLVTHLYTSLVGPAHYASAENHYQELFFEDIPAWSIVSLQAEDPAIKWAFWGLPSGATIPWRAWAVPLSAWSGFYLLLFLNYLCLAGLFQRQWSQKQRMLFPLAEIPFQMARYRGREALPGPLRSPWFWVAFAVPLVIHSLNGLNAHYPQISGVNIYPYYLAGAFRGRPWDELNYLPFFFYFDVIGITYLLPAEISFSLWFFYLFKYALAVGRSWVGATATDTFFDHVGIGSYVLVAAMTVWQARESLGEIARRAIGRDAPTPASRGSATPPGAGGAERGGAARTRWSLPPATTAGSVGLGVFAGLLPCPLTVALLVSAAGAGSVTAGMLLLAGAGVGTVPGLALAGAAGALMGGRGRAVGLRGLGAVVVALGALMILRRVGVVPGGCCR